MYDVIVIGGGPAGISAGLHAAQNKLKTLVLTKNIPPAEPEVLFALVGFPELLKTFKKTLETHTQFIALAEHQEVANIEKNIVSFTAETKEGVLHYARSIIIATGSTGLDGNTGFDLITLKDSTGKIKVDVNLKTNIPGIFAAGGVVATAVTNTPAAIFDGGKAALSVKDFLK
jgi:thioredoxin reductase (NADPH)